MSGIHRVGVCGAMPKALSVPASQGAPNTSLPPPLGDLNWLAPPVIALGRGEEREGPARSPLASQASKSRGHLRPWPGLSHPPHKTVSTSMPSKWKGDARICRHRPPSENSNKSINDSR